MPLLAVLVFAGLATVCSPCSYPYLYLECIVERIDTPAHCVACELPAASLAANRSIKLFKLQVIC